MVKSFNAARSEIPLDRFQRRNKTNITSLSGVRLKRMTTCWKDNLMHLAMEQKFSTCSALDKGAIQRRKVQQQTTEKVMTMSKDDWKAECTKDDNLKLTKARGNKIRRIMTPPIFSSGMLDILLVE